jgi:ABC-type transport system involved in cytochrome bd biosynthesis fused ATPase/permease subunit
LLKETTMMRDVFLRWTLGGRLIVALLAVPLLSVGCTRELEEKLAGRERELSETQAALKTAQDQLATLEATHLKQGEQLREVEPDGHRAAPADP